MGAHLLRLVGEDRVELAVALVAASGDEDFVAVANRHDLAFAARHRPLHLELRVLGEEISRDAKDRGIGVCGRREVAFLRELLIHLLAEAIDITGGKSRSGH